MKAQNVYITCPRKGQPKKHVAVCKRCRWKNCKPFQKYAQPEIPFIFEASSTDG
jgi:hypothetical protein